MKCDDLTKRLDDWFDGTLEAAEHQAVAEHLSACETCQRRFEAEAQWRRRLKEAPVAEPAADFEQRMLAAAHGHGDARRRWTTPVVSGAMAACLAAGLMLGQWLPVGDPGATGEEPVVAEPIVMDEVQTVSLAFNSGEALNNVTLTLELPPHVELDGFPGERSLSWQVDLDKGRNRLALPVRTLFPGEGELVAHLEDGERRKTFRASISHEGVTSGS